MIDPAAMNGFQKLIDPPDLELNILNFNIINHTRQGVWS